MKGSVTAAIAIVLISIMPVLDGKAWPRLEAADEGGGGMDVNIIVRELRVTPARVAAGETVRIEMVVENRAEGAGSARSAVSANGRTVATGIYSFGWGGEGGRITRESFTWDTKGAVPGEYRIKGFVTVWEDTSPSDNELEIPEPLVILPAGSAGVPAGTLSARDPRYRTKGD